MEPPSKAVSRGGAGPDSNQRVTGAKTATLTLYQMGPRPFVFMDCKSHNETTMNILLLDDVIFSDDKIMAQSEDRTCQGHTGSMTQWSPN